MNTVLFNVWLLTTWLVIFVTGIDTRDDIQVLKRRPNVDFQGCELFEKQCTRLEDDLARLSCALNSARNNKTHISFTCQHTLWSYQAELLTGNFLDIKLSQPCLNEILILDCLKQKDERIDCILKKKESVKNRICWRIINKIETIIFNDWQITKGFLKSCWDDIHAYTCGRIPSDPKSLSQTQTLQCLRTQQQSLHPECVDEVNALQDMKYSSLFLDKIVFAACNVDQKNFCPDEVSGSWFMYKCLLKHNYEKAMTKKCQDQLFFTKRNIVMNYKMSKGLVKSCKEDIRKYHCRKGVVDDKDVKLAQILLCLESVSKNESVKLSPQCTAEMIDHRKMLMDDYRLSPELMQDCANDIAVFCKGIETGGKTIHCLMEYTRPRRRKDRRISMVCQKAVETLIQEADPGEDWRVDPVLRKACKQVVDRACAEIGGGNGKVISCLMEKIGTSFMNSECETALMQIQYFISRDFKLDPQLYNACKSDAITHCKANLQWADSTKQQSNKDPLILPCLYNYAYNSNFKGVLNPACEYQVKRVMRQRSISVDLLPEIEDVCMEDLTSLCYENSGKGEEIQCLQFNIKKLTPNCQEAVTKFTEIQSGRIELNAVVNNNCKTEIVKLCYSELESKEGDVIECLISHKNDPEIKANIKCRATIEHEQLISLKNYKFTRKFKNACKSYVVRFCPKAQTKSQVVTCLSEIVRNDTINERKPTIFKDCRHQLRSQLFQQKESIDLDPELKEACKNELVLFCNNIPHQESAALECLQTTNEKISDACQRALFVVKKQEFTDNAVDYHLIKSCSDMIDIYCHHTDLDNNQNQSILDCLKAHHKENHFDDTCKMVIVNRMREQNADYRLNNNLQIHCKLDIKKYCMKIVAEERQDIALQGKVLQCLKDKFREAKLSSSCENELAYILKEQALNYRLNPLLEKLCKAEIQTICANTNDSIINPNGQVEECLKNALLNHKIVSVPCAQEVVQIIEETEVDIEVDPLLEQACAHDLLKYCIELEHGAGRRLKCLKIILNDSTRKLEPACEKSLKNRLEMYRYVASVKEVNDLGDVYNEISSSPSKKYFLVVGISVIGLIFMFGLYCGRMTKRAMYIKRK